MAERSISSISVLKIDLEAPKKMRLDIEKGAIWLVLLAATAIPAGCGVQILLPIQEPLDFAGNMSLVVEDVDIQAGEVWLNLLAYDGSLLKSAVLGKGEHFTYYGVTRIDLVVQNIYAGGDSDLVSLDLIEGLLVP